MASSLVFKKLLAQARSFVPVTRLPLGVPIVRQPLGGVRLITTSHVLRDATGYTCEGPTDGHSMPSSPSSPEHTKESLKNISELARVLNQVMNFRGLLPQSGWSGKFTFEGEFDFDVKEQDQKKTEVTKKFTKEGNLVIKIAACGFRKDHLTLRVEDELLYVMGKGMFDGELISIDEVVSINPEHLFDAEKVSAELVAGYLNVNFPKGTKETMAREIFIVKWA